MHHVQHKRSLSAHLTKGEFQSLDIDGQIEKPTNSVSDGLSTLKATVKHREPSLDTEAAYMLSGGFGGHGVAPV